MTVRLSQAEGLDNGHRSIDEVTLGRHKREANAIAGKLVECEQRLEAGDTGPDDHDFRGGARCAFVGHAPKLDVKDTSGIGVTPRTSFGKSADQPARKVSRAQPARSRPARRHCGPIQTKRIPTRWMRW